MYVCTGRAMRVYALTTLRFKFHNNIFCKYIHTHTHTHIRPIYLFHKRILWFYNVRVFLLLLNLLNHHTIYVYAGPQDHNFQRNATELKCCLQDFRYIRPIYLFHKRTLWFYHTVVYIIMCVCSCYGYLLNHHTIYNVYAGPQLSTERNGIEVLFTGL